MSIMLLERDQAIWMDLCNIAPPALSLTLCKRYKVPYRYAVVNDYGTSIDIEEEGLIILSKINGK